MGRLLDCGSGEQPQRDGGGDSSDGSTANATYAIA
jgi:hypothetical protein